MKVIKVNFRAKSKVRKLRKLLKDRRRYQKWVYAALTLKLLSLVAVLLLLASIT